MGQSRPYGPLKLVKGRVKHPKVGSSTTPASIGTDKGAPLQDAPMTIEPLRPEHREIINPSGFDAEVLTTLRAWPLSDNDPGFACLIDGQVVVMAGITVLWPGVAQGYMVISPLIDPHTYHQAIRQGIEAVRVQQGLWRFQVDINIGDPVEREWACLLGFHAEGVMEKYDPDGSDCIRYARVWREK